MFESFLNAVRNLFKVPDLRKRVLFTLGMLVIYRTGIHIPVPGVDREALAQLWGQLGGMFGVLDLFSGGNLRRISIFALGIMPYITASIILQLMTSIDFMGLKKVQEEGEIGRRKAGLLRRPSGSRGRFLIHIYLDADVDDRNDLRHVAR